MSNVLRLHGLRRARLSSSLQSPRVCSNSCLLSQWYHPSISFFVTPFSSFSFFPTISVFSKKLALHVIWPKYWSFSFRINPSNDYSGLISLRIDWVDILALQGTLESSPALQFKSINSSKFSPLYGPILTSILDYWKANSFDYTDLCQQSDVSAF